MPEVNFHHDNRITVRRKHDRWRWLKKRKVSGCVGQFTIKRRGKTEIITWQMPILALGELDDADIDAWESRGAKAAEIGFDRTMDDLWRWWDG